MRFGNASRFHVEDVAALAAQHRGARNVRRLAVALDSHDPGAESPKETWLRMLLIDEGFPRPQTQIPVPGPDGQPLYFLDMGWEDLKVAVEYDGEHHRTDRPSYAKDVIRLEYIASVGWLVIRVLAGNVSPTSCGECAMPERRDCSEIEKIRRISISLQSRRKEWG